MPHLHLLGTQQAQRTSPRCYLSLRPVPRRHRFAYVHRDGNRTLLINDPNASRLELSERALDLLTPQERGIYRAAYGAVDGRLPAALFEGPALLYVPPSLRLAGAQAIQGGEVALRRYEAGDLTEELHLLAHELGRAASNSA